MAGDWIVWTKGLADKREVRAVARKLGVDRRIVACCSMLLWEWVDSESGDGHVQGATTADIDEIVGLPGFADALADSGIGWLRVTNCGITVPNFERHNGETAKTRAKDRRRKHLARSDICPENVRKKTDKPRTREQKKDQETPKGFLDPVRASETFGGLAGLTAELLSDHERFAGWLIARHGKAPPLSDEPDIALLATAIAVQADDSAEDKLAAFHQRLIAGELPPREISQAAFEILKTTRKATHGSTNGKPGKPQRKPRQQRGPA